ncbi:MAG: hypothetical protein EA378_05135 [Phycisphaerales bacterium]|nr:MAG: hypothetical protein EA378_05135 [Phycisphaerales bacterium]
MLAFSLVEVLLAIVILSLGLLGLGAVIPVVIRQQRIANETTLGVNAANNAESAIRSRIDLRSRQRVSGTGSNVSPWHAWRNSETAGGMIETTRPGLWRVPEIDRETGRIQLPSGNVSFLAPAERYSIPLSQRLTPAAETGGPPPRFVWDFVARRVVSRIDDSTVRITPNDPIMIAVFVRRVDPSIRLPGGVSLARALVDSGPGGLALESRRVPVAVGTDGRPTLNGVIGAGNAGYGQPIVLQVAQGQPDYERADSPTPTRDDDRDRLQFSTANTNAQLPPGTDVQTAIALASQINQLLVDNFGNVYRVVGRDGQRVIIDPPVPAWVRNMSELQVVAFVPQVASEVKVFTITTN